VRRVLSQELIKSSVRYDPSSKLLYLDNAKVASRTLVYSLWKGFDNRNGTSHSERFGKAKHQGDRGPLITDLFKGRFFGSPEMRNAVVFSVVRNPFTRTLSAYLQKVGKRGEPSWEKFTRRYRLKRSVTQDDVSFLDFLKLIADEPDEALDRHFGPQYLNLLLPFSSPKFVGRVEAMEEVAKFLADFDVSLEFRAPHATNANEKVFQAYTPECIDIVRRKFADDFRIFGYSTDISDIDSFGPMTLEPGNDLVLDWIVTKKPPLEHLDPAPRLMLEFMSAETPGERLRLARAAVAIEDNWKRLTVYAEFALKQGDLELCKCIVDKVVELRANDRPPLDKARLFAWRPDPSGLASNLIAETELARTGRLRVADAAES